RAEHSCGIPNVAVVRTIGLAAAILLLGSAALAHQPDSKPAGAADLPATLVPGMGSLHHPVRTTSVEAQKFFDQGLSFLYAFNHPEAVRSFKRAAQLDPQMAMAYWGIALALGSGRAVEIEDGVAYDEPPAWYLPVRESLGGALLRQGRFADAERVFRTDLERNRGNGRPLFGLMAALSAPQRSYEAALGRQPFEGGWRPAGPSLRQEDL